MKSAGPWGSIDGAAVAERLASTVELEPPPASLPCGVLHGVASGVEFEVREFSEVAPSAARSVGDSAVEGDTVPADSGVVATSDAPGCEFFFFLRSNES